MLVQRAYVSKPAVIYLMKILKLKPLSRFEKRLPCAPKITKASTGVKIIFPECHFALLVNKR